MITLSAEQIWWISAEYQPFFPVYHTEDRVETPNPGLARTKNEETMSSNLSPCLRHSLFWFPSSLMALEPTP